MKVKQYKKIKLVLFGLVSSAFAYAILSGSAHVAFVGFLGIGFYMVVASLIQTRVDQVADERQVMVAEKAAQTSFRVLLPMLLLTTVALIAGGGTQEYHYVRALGLILAYITCLGLVIYLLTYWYFNKKSGG